MKFNKSMVDFVLDKKRLSETDAISVFNITNYANFLSQKFELWMFVPAVFKDGKWVVLEEPEIYKITAKTHLQPEIIEYQTALSKVIFEGFEWQTADFMDDYVLELEDKIGNYLLYNVDDKHFTINTDDIIYKIEDLLKYNLDIKESVAQELGLI